jgi:hypothetical protein
MGVQALSPSTQPLRAICVKLRARAQHEAHPTTRPKYRYRGLGGAPKSPKESSAASKGRETSPAAQWVCSKSFPPWTARLSILLQSICRFFLSPRGALRVVRVFNEQCVGVKICMSRKTLRANQWIFLR